MGPAEVSTCGQIAIPIDIKGLELYVHIVERFGGSAQTTGRAETVIFHRPPASVIRVRHQGGDQSHERTRPACWQPR